MFPGSLKAILFLSLVVSSPANDPPDTPANRALLHSALEKVGYIAPDTPLCDQWSWQLECARYWWKVDHSAPPLGDINRLPDRDTARERWQFAVKHVEYLEKQLEIEAVDWKWKQISDSLEEARKLCATWSLIDDIRHNYYYDDGWPPGIPQQRERLMRLRDKIGPARYYAGDFGPWVPVWRFRRVD